MEYISAEEFLKQDKEVQKVFLDWWKPSFGDLFTTRRVYDEIDVIIDITENDLWGMNNTFKGNIYSSVDKSLMPFPLFTEGQLRKFIEDKTCGISSIYFRCNNISINIYDNDSPTCIKRYERLGIDLLQAYWKVALEIAKESQ